MQRRPQIPERLGPGWDVVSFTVMGTNAAADRLAAVNWHDPHLAYAAVGETLWWITTLDTMLKRFLGETYIENRRAENVVSRQLSALRHARHRFTHAFDLLEVVEPGGDPQQQDYGTPGYWRWRPLPPSKRSGGETGEREYQTFLAGKLVSSTLVNALTFLRNQAWYVEPSLGSSSPTARR